MKKRTIKGLLTLAIIALLTCLLLCACNKADDTGIIEISTAEDLIRISERMDRDYILVNDIDLTAYPDWEPIGGAYGKNIFTGTLDGNGYSISGLRRTNSFAEKDNRIYFGLFGHVGGAGRVVNLTFKNVNVSMTGPAVDNSQTRVFCGALAGAFYGTAENVTVANGTMSYNVCTNGCAYTGGLFGLAIGATIKNCVNGSAVVSGRYGSSGGGICGYASNTKFENCKNAGSVSTYCTSFGGAAYSGGIVGEAFSNNPNEYIACENIGNLSFGYYGDFDPSSSLGGLLGWISGGALNWHGDSNDIEAHKINELIQ